MIHEDISEKSTAAEKMFAGYQIREMFPELNRLENGDIEARMHEVPGLTKILADHFCRESGGYDEMLFEAELQERGQKAVPGPLSGLPAEDIISRLLARTATSDALPRRS